MKRDPLTTLVRLNDGRPALWLDHLADHVRRLGEVAAHGDHPDALPDFLALLDDQVPPIDPDDVTDPDAVDAALDDVRQWWHDNGAWQIAARKMLEPEDPE